ncbi:MAG: hypothetical protein CMF25_05875 [Kangiellaceae bacterium]|nr:hypothetical protein [Kangiellaceae bacterium]
MLDENTIGTINELPYIVNGSLTDVTNTPFVYSDNAERDISYVSIQDVWDFHNDWSLTAGVRYDDYSDFGSTTNPRLALVWSTSHNLTTKLLYGEAFRAPSFSELYSKNNPVIIGNLELEPEEIKTSELVFDYRPTEHLSLNLTFFHYQADQLIEFVPQPDGTSKAQNVRGQDGQGFETEIDWQPNDKVHLITNFAFQDTEDAKTGDRIADAPRKQLYSRFDLDLRENLTYFSQLNWVIDRERAKGDPRDDLENYATLDVGLRAQRVFDNMNIGLTVRNLTDEDIVEPSSGTIDDYPMEGRHFVGEVSFKF